MLTLTGASEEGGAPDDEDVAMPVDVVGKEQLGNDESLVEVAAVVTGSSIMYWSESLWPTWKSSGSELSKSWT